MTERNISGTDLKEALENPDISYKGKRGEFNAVKDIGGNRRIRVVYVVKGKNKIVITAMLKP
jgi:hypothetical protein